MPQHSNISLLSRVRTWFRNLFRKSKKNQNISSVVFLPQDACLMGGAFHISLPPDFEFLRTTPEQTTLFGRKCGLILTINRTAFNGQLQQMTEDVFQHAFLQNLAIVEILSFRHDYVRHSPRVTVHYVNNMYNHVSQRCTTVLLQRKDFVYNLLFTGNIEQNLALIDTMISTMQT